MDAPDLVKLMAELDDKPQPAITLKAIEVRFYPGEWVMRCGEFKSKPNGDGSLVVHMGKVIAVRINRRGAKYRIAWGEGGRPEWCDGEGLEGIEDDEE